MLSWCSPLLSVCFLLWCFVISIVFLVFALCSSGSPLCSVLSRLCFVLSRLYFVLSLLLTLFLPCCLCDFSCCLCVFSCCLRVFASVLGFIPRCLPLCLPCRLPLCLVSAVGGPMSDASCPVVCAAWRSVAPSRCMITRLQVRPATSRATGETAARCRGLRPSRAKLKGSECRRRNSLWERVLDLPLQWSATSMEDAITEWANEFYKQVRAAPQRARRRSGSRAERGSSIKPTVPGEAKLQEARVAMGAVSKMRGRM